MARMNFCGHILINYRLTCTRIRFIYSLKPVKKIYRLYGVRSILSCYRYIFCSTQKRCIWGPGYGRLPAAIRLSFVGRRLLPTHQSARGYRGCLSSSVGVVCSQFWPAINHTCKRKWFFFFVFTRSSFVSLWIAVFRPSSVAHLYTWSNRPTPGDIWAFPCAIVYCLNQMTISNFFSKCQTVILDILAAGLLWSFVIGTWLSVFNQFLPLNSCWLGTLTT